MSKIDANQRRVSIRLPNPTARLRLFCLPYAGGGASIYRQWSQRFPADIEIAAVQLPGREWRIQEPLISDMEELAGDTLDSIRPYLDKPFALLGTSMGGTLIFELTHRIKALGLPMPVGLFPCACGAPHIPEPKPLHHLPDAELLAEIRDYGVMSEEVQQHPELEELFLPVIRNDCIAHETYVSPEPLPFDIPIWVYGGLYDETIEKSRLAGWAIHTSAASQVHMVDGGHLFVDNPPDLFIQSIVRRLNQSLD